MVVHDRDPQGVGPLAGRTPPAAPGRTAARTRGAGAPGRRPGALVRGGVAAADATRGGDPPLRARPAVRGRSPMRSASPRRRRAPTRTKDEGSSDRCRRSPHEAEDRLGRGVRGGFPARGRVHPGPGSPARPRRRRVHDRRLPGGTAAPREHPGRARTSGVPRRRPRRRAGGARRDALPQGPRGPQAVGSGSTPARGLLRGAGAPGSERRSTGRSHGRASRAACSRRRPRSPSARSRPTGTSPNAPGAPARPARPATPCTTTRSRSSCPATGSCLRGAALASTAARSGGRSTCSGWRGALAGP